MTTPETPPKILGRKMDRHVASWRLYFGKVLVEIVDWARPEVHEARICGVSVIGVGSMSECTAAIERELLAIRAAIPEPKP